MCETAADEDSEVYRVITENKGELVTQMITNKGLEKASRQLHMSPLRVADMIPTTEYEDTTAMEEGPNNYHRRQHPQASVLVEDNTETGTDGVPEMSQAMNTLSEIGNGETMDTRRDKSPFSNDDDGDQEFGGYPRHSKSAERPRIKRLKYMNKGLEDPQPVAMVQQ